MRPDFSKVALLLISAYARSYVGTSDHMSRSPSERSNFFFILGTRCRHTGGIHIWVAIANVTGSTHVLRHNWISYKKQSQPWSWSCNSIYSAEKRVKQPHQATVRADNCDVNALLALSHFHGIRLGSYHPICAVQVLISRLSTSRVFTSETFNKQERNNW